MSSYEDTLAAIDGAIHDHELSEDAMRWVPEDGREGIAEYDTDVESHYEGLATARFSSPIAVAYRTPYQEAMRDYMRWSFGSPGRGRHTLNFALRFNRYQGYEVEWPRAEGLLDTRWREPQLMSNLHQFKLNGRTITWCAPALPPRSSSIWHRDVAHPPKASTFTDVSLDHLAEQPMATRSTTLARKPPRDFSRLDNERHRPWVRDR